MVKYKFYPQYINDMVTYSILQVLQVRKIEIKVELSLYFKYSNEG